MRNLTSNQEAAVKNEFNYWMRYIASDFQNAGKDFIRELKANPIGTTNAPLIIQYIEATLAGNENKWQFTLVTNAADALCYLIGDTLLRRIGLGSEPTNISYVERIAKIYSSPIVPLNPGNPTSIYGIVAFAHQFERLQIFFRYYGFNIDYFREWPMITDEEIQQYYGERQKTDYKITKLPPDDEPHDEPPPPDDEDQMPP